MSEAARSDLPGRVRSFLSAERFAVAGASDDPAKFGHRCYAALLRNGYAVYPVNPRATEVLGNPTFPDLASLPEPVQSLSIVTPPPVTEQVVEQAIRAGVRSVWMQPGAESAAAVRRAEEAGLEVISGGPCLLVALASGRV
ncbi:MAG: CoA-binding protein [Armatimonadota bacterium]